MFGPEGVSCSALGADSGGKALEWALSRAPVEACSATLSAAAPATRLLDRVGSAREGTSTFLGRGAACARDRALLTDSEDTCLSQHAHLRCLARNPETRRS
eukprot:5175192-Pleurochrysis_carterae.AAC.8